MRLSSILFTPSLLNLFSRTLAQVPTPAAQSPTVSIKPSAVPSAGQQSNQGAAVTPQIPAAPSPATSDASATSSALRATNSAGVGGQGGAEQIPVWVIKVGDEKNDIVFSPNSITAKPGEMVQFQFFSKNHSVASSTFEQPCVPMMQANPGIKANAFWSGFMPTNQQGQLTYTVPIRDTSPVWFYCSQGMHCQGGMVGVINPPASGQSLADYQARAAKAPANISPGGALAVAPNVGGGQIGGAVGPNSTAPVAPAATRSAASEVLGISRGLGVVAAVAWLLL